MASEKCSACSIPPSVILSSYPNITIFKDPSSVVSITGSSGSSGATGSSGIDGSGIPLFPSEQAVRQRNSRKIIHNLFIYRIFKKLKKEAIQDSLFILNQAIPNH
ncbi:hypothetical protein [uncultured Mediterranea sp.]|uniref:hypothetical protein n=1 Tax=uncultured Mediterranea sp. TaxID=1926662 RepID=UPI0028048D57|nr:hypothetical protein [uncultured Mediterranea sp.]